MTQQNRTPKDNTNLVDAQIVRQNIRTASLNSGSAKEYVDNMYADEPNMMGQVDTFVRHFSGTIQDLIDVSLSSNADKSKQDRDGLIQSSLALLFSLGFKTGEENMRRFYGEALDGLIVSPHKPLNDEDFA